MWLRWRRYRYRRKTDAAIMQSFLEAELPLPDAPPDKVAFLTVDLETTSLDPKHGEIVSIGWVPIDNGRVMLCAAEHHAIAVKRGVGQSAVFHHIRDSALNRAPALGVAMEAFLAAARGRVLVFHNAALDMGFLDAASRKLYGVPIAAPVVDTLALEKNKWLRLREGLASGELRLFACRERYGLPDYPAHNALTDAVATAELLLAHLAHRGRDSRLEDLL